MDHQWSGQRRLTEVRARSIPARIIVPLFSHCSLRVYFWLQNWGYVGMRGKALPVPIVCNHICIC
jgi:hypothetical protein